MTHPNRPDEPLGPSRERLKLREELDVPEEIWECLDEKGVTARSVLELFRIRVENKQRYRSLLDWVRSGRGQTRTELLRRLVERRQGVGYVTLAEELDVRENYVRRLVTDLRNKEIVETPGRPALVQFKDDETYLLASDVARMA